MEFATVTKTERHFFRCLRCCNVFAVEGEPARNHPRGWNGIPLPGARCPEWAFDLRCDCGQSGRLEWMGRVGSDSLIRTEDRCACDSRCTSARGPKCDCVCGGKNHGKHRVVAVTTVEGIPTIVDADLDKRIAAVAQWEAALAAAQARVDADPTVARMRTGDWIDDRAAWERASRMLAALRKSSNYKTIAGRIAALAKVQS